MKIFKYFLIVLLCAVSANAQWRKQSVDTKANLRGLSVVSERIIWASGANGTVLRTVDGGANWSVIQVPGAEKLDFRDIEAFDKRTAYVLSIGDGENSRIYKTADGGKTWQLQFQNENPKAFFDALAFWDAKHGIAMSDPVDGKFLLLETKDGATWKPIKNLRMPTVAQGEAAFAASGTCLIAQGKNTAFLVSGGNAARVYKSVNRGVTWRVYETPMPKGTPGSGIFSLAMFARKRGVIVGGNYEKPDEANDNIAFTADGGATWKASKGLYGYRSGVIFLEKNMLIAVGSNGSDITTDGGVNWRRIDKENYNAIQAKGFRAVWAVGANGLVSEYTEIGDIIDDLPLD